MARHQIIYTSCMRGIDGVNDGQQIFSYDAGFSENKSAEVKSLFTYQVPSLPPGVIMTEDLAQTMPSAFSYRLLKNGSAAVTLNTYLGRDYMGSAGRFGNHLSHSVVCDFYDMDIYPCEIYGSPTLRSSMEYSQVNNPESPAHLPEAELELGYIADPESIIDFLGIGENLKYYKKMVCAMLRFSTEKKRIVICDESENIIMWIAALHYALPIDIAKRVNFTTYEFDPELSSAQICGVITEGSRYNAGSYVSSGKHYVFDFINLQFNEVAAENQLVDYLDTAFSFSYDSLTEFHEFVINKTVYREANEEYYSAYNLYSFLTEGISELSLKEFQDAISFSDMYATDEMKIEILYKLIKESQAINTLNNEYASVVIKLILKDLNVLNAEQQSAVKQLIVDRLILLLSDEQISQADFVTLYNNIDHLARAIHLSIPAELMESHNGQALLQFMSQSVVIWKLHFVVRIISDYVKDTRLSIDELYPDRPIGNIYFGIIKAVYATGRNNGFDIIEKILDNFKNNSSYLVNMAWNMEGFLDDLSLEEMDKKHLWDYFTQLVLQMNREDLIRINTVFLEYERFDKMFFLYKAGMEKENDFKAARVIFKDTFEYWFAKSYNYAYAYSEKVLEIYEEAYESKLNILSNDERYLYAKEILHIAMEMKVESAYLDILMQEIAEYMPLEKPNQENEKHIAKIQDYQCNVRNKKVGGKLLLFCIGINFDKIVSKRDIEKCTGKINAFADESGANVSSLGEKGADAYFEWILANPLKYSLAAKDYTNIFQLFIMSRETGRQFMEHCYKVIYNKSKDAKDYKNFAEFLKFMFEYGTSEDIENIGKYICRLSKQKLEELDEEMKDLFRRDRGAAHGWDNVRDIAKSTNPLLNNLSELFKRRKN